MYKKYLLHEVRSKPDTYGNVYETTTATNNETGQSITVQESAGNIRYYLINLANVDHSQIYTTSEQLAIRDYNRKAKRAKWMHSSEILAAIL